MNMDRHDKVLSARNAGLTFKQIGDSLGVSATRARSVFISAKLKQDSAIKWTDGLTTRASNGLLSVGFSSKDEVLIAAKTGRLKRMPIPNIGAKGITEIYNWLGLAELYDRENKLIHDVSDQTIRKAISVLKRCGYEITKDGEAQ